MPVTVSENETLFEPEDAATELLAERCVDRAQHLQPPDPRLLAHARFGDLPAFLEAGLLEREIAFLDALRVAGIQVSLAEVLDSTRAMGAIDLMDRESLRHAFAACVLKRPAHRTTFDTLFDLWFPPAIGDSVAGEFDEDGELTDGGDVGEDEPRQIVCGAWNFGAGATVAVALPGATVAGGLTLFPLVALTILFGVYPKPVLDMSAASVQQLVNNYNTAVTAVKAAALVVQ